MVHPRCIVHVTVDGHSFDYTRLPDTSTDFCCAETMAAESDGLAPRDDDPCALCVRRNHVDGTVATYVSRRLSKMAETTKTIDSMRRVLG